MLAEGLGNKSYCAAFGHLWAYRQVHVSSIFTKLNASNRTRAVTLGARQSFNYALTILFYRCTQ